MAPRIPGEPPRVPWPTAPASRLERVRPTDPNRPYDEAVRRMGGEVLEFPGPAGETRLFNCHSYALTGGEGDLADPFSDATGGRWVTKPTYQLAKGAYGQLRPDQRVHPGDVVVYADAHGVPLHSGIVREVDADGNPTLVESKWSGFGVFRHGPFDQPSNYGTAMTFYRPEDPAAPSAGRAP
jgi:hypothetical protein